MNKIFVIKVYNDTMRNPTMKWLIIVIEKIYIVIYFAIGILAFPMLYLFSLCFRGRRHYEESGYDK